MRSRTKRAEPAGDGSWQEQSNEVHRAVESGTGVPETTEPLGEGSMGAETLPRRVSARIGQFFPAQNIEAVPETQLIQARPAAERFTSGNALLASVQ